MSTGAATLAPVGAARPGPIWAGAFALAAGAHLALALLLLDGPAVATVPEDAAPVMEIDLAPPATAPSEPSADASPSEPVPDEPAPEPVSEAATDPSPEAGPAPPVAVAPAPSATPDLPTPRLPVASTGLIPPPAPSRPVPAPPPKVAAAPVRPPDRAPVDIRPPRPSPVRQPNERRPPARAVGTARIAAIASATSGASAASSAAWRSSLVAHLQRSLRYPPGATQAGAAFVSFSVDRQGRVLSASLSRASGNPSLDAAAMAIFRAPVPRPPPDYSGSLSFNIPIRFTQR